MSGGEPLLQPAFTRAAPDRRQGAWPAHRARHLRLPRRRADDALLDATDLVLLDIKAGTTPAIAGADRPPLAPDARVRAPARRARHQPVVGALRARPRLHRRARGRRGVAASPPRSATSSASTSCRSTSSARPSTRRSAWPSPAARPSRPPPGSLTGSARHSPPQACTRSDPVRADNAVMSRRPWRPDRRPDHPRTVTCKDAVECRRELAVPVADQEPEAARPLAEVHQEVAGLLGGPGPGRVHGFTDRRSYLRLVPLTSAYMFRGAIPGRRCPLCVRAPGSGAVRRTDGHGRRGQER